jgi:hypothetical protein
MTTRPAFPTTASAQLCPNLYKVFDPNLESARTVFAPTSPFEFVDVPASENIFLMRPATFISLPLFLSTYGLQISAAARSAISQFPSSTSMQTPINNYAFTSASTLIGRTALGKPFQVSPQGVINYGFQGFLSPFAQAFN